MNGALPGTRLARTGEACGFAAANDRMRFGSAARSTIPPRRARALRSTLRASEAPELPDRHPRNCGGLAVLDRANRSLHARWHGEHWAACASFSIADVKASSFRLNGWGLDASGA